MFDIAFSQQSAVDYDKLESKPTYSKHLKAVRKALGYLETNPKHPGLQTHRFFNAAGPNNEKVFTAYAQNNTPGAHRILWHYGPSDKAITIVSITSHY